MEKPLSGKKVALFAEQQYEDLELWYPKLRLTEAGAEVTVIGPEAKTYASKHGYPVEAERGIQDVEPSQFDALVIPGGYAPDHMRRNPAMVEFVRHMVDEGKIVGAICHAGWMLASANVIEGRRVTGWSSIKDDLLHAGGHYEDAEVIQDGNLITSRMPKDLPAFCRQIIGAMSLDPVLSD